MFGRVVTGPGAWGGVKGAGSEAGMTGVVRVGAVPFEDAHVGKVR